MADQVHSKGIAVCVLVALAISIPVACAFIFPQDASVAEEQNLAKQVELGHSYYLRSCAHCHADDATGDEGPDLHHLYIGKQRIATVIRKGIKGQMPAFYKKYNESQIQAIASYLKTLE